MNILDLLFPKSCLGCKATGKYICPTCLAKVERAKLVCPVCKKHSFQGRTHTYCVKKYTLDGMYAFYKHEGVIRKAILKLKYNFASDIAKELVESLVFENWKLEIENCTLVPVPLHKKRQAWRGFNQAAILGKLFAEKMGWEFNDELFLRLEDTTPQVKLGKEERTQNIRGKFAVNNKTLSVILESRRGGSIESQPIIIIFDDVWTTGATLNEAGKVLKKAGAKEVWGMSVARS